MNISGVPHGNYSVIVKRGAKWYLAREGMEAASAGNLANKLHREGEIARAMYGEPPEGMEKIDLTFGTDSEEVDRAANDPFLNP